MRRGIICGGSFCVDHNKQINRWPEQETVAIIHGEDASGGGSSHNLSVGLKKLGAPFPVEIVALVGDDKDGELLRQIVTDHGIDDRQIHTTNQVQTSYTDALMPVQSGRRTHFYYPGTNGHISPDHFDFEKTNCRILHLGLPGLHETMDATWKGDASGWVAVLKAARTAGLKTNLELVSVDDHTIHRIGLPCVEHLDYLIINDSEVGGLTGIQTVSEGITDIKACEEAIDKILMRGPMEFVIVHFPMGAIACTKSGYKLKIPSVAISQDDIAGTNGAGDAFAAGVLLAIHEGETLNDAMVLGHASSAASLRNMTTVGAVENHKTCLEMAEKYGFRDGF